MSALLYDGRLARYAKPEDNELLSLLHEAFGYTLKKTNASAEALYQYQIIKGGSSWAID